MGETDSIVFRRSVDLLILPGNAVNQITTYMITKLLNIESVRS